MDIFNGLAKLSWAIATMAFLAYAVLSLFNRKYAGAMVVCFGTFVLGVAVTAGGLLLIEALNEPSLLISTVRITLIRLKSYLAAILIDNNP